MEQAWQARQRSHVTSPERFSAHFGQWTHSMQTGRWGTSSGGAPASLVPSPAKQAREDNV